MTPQRDLLYSYSLSWTWQLCLVALLLSGCVRAAFKNPEFTVAVQSEAISPSSTPGSLAVQTAADTAESSTATAELPAADTPSPQSDSVLPAATATEFANQSAHTLAAFPLQVGNSWVYAYQAYSGDEKATWQEVDTIIDERQSGMLRAVEVQQEISQVEKTPVDAGINIPQSVNYWYILSGNKLYRQWRDLDWTKIESSSLELVWPFPAQGCWFPDPEQRSNPALRVEPDFPGCRSAQGPVTLQLLTGRVDHCYHLKTPYNDGALFEDFCEQVGFVGGKYDHAGTPFGDSWQLTAYSLQNK